MGYVQIERTFLLAPTKASRSDAVGFERWKMARVLSLPHDSIDGTVAFPVNVDVKAWSGESKSIAIRECSQLDKIMHVFVITVDVDRPTELIILNIVAEVIIIPRQSHYQQSHIE